MPIAANILDFEKAEDSNVVREVKTDHRGLPLVPQLSDNRLDPLIWPLWLKLHVLLQVSILSLLALLSASVITPTFEPLSKYLHQSLTKTAYVTSISIAFGGLSSLFWNPVAYVFGRRPIYIVSIAVSIATSAASGPSRHYGEILAFCALNGFFGCVALGLGSASVCDLFYEHERGLFMGIYTLSLITGGHVAPIIGGYIEKNLSWRWCFYVAAILEAVMLPLFILSVPETLWVRAQNTTNQTGQSWASNMAMHRTFHPHRNLRLVDFLRPLHMLKYPSVLLPTIYYAVSFGYGTILFIITSANIFAKVYHFQPYQTGLLLGVPLTVGSISGEVLSGGFSDWISNRRALKRGNMRKLEDRLLALLPAVVLLPLGVIVAGVCIQHKTHWGGVGMGTAIASFGLQVITTVIYTYTAECYRQQAAEIGSLLNFARQVFGFCVGFYAVPLGERVDFQSAWIVFAFIDVACAFPVVLLIFSGESWRRSLGQPSFHSEM